MREEIWEKMCFGCIGLLTSFRESIKAFSWWGLSEKWRSIVVPIEGLKGHPVNRDNFRRVLHDHLVPR